MSVWLNHSVAGQITLMSFGLWPCPYVSLKNSYLKIHIQNRHLGVSLLFSEIRKKELVKKTTHFKCILTNEYKKTVWYQRMTIYTIPLWIFFSTCLSFCHILIAGLLQCDCWELAYETEAAVFFVNGKLLVALCFLDHRSLGLSWNKICIYITTCWK